MNETSKIESGTIEKGGIEVVGVQPEQSIGDIIVDANEQMESALKGAQKEISNVEGELKYKSLMEVREKFGTLISKLGTSYFREDPEGGYFMITTQSEGMRGPKGSAPIDMKLNALQAKELYEDLKRKMDDINKLPPTLPAQPKTHEELVARDSNNELKQARDEFGTLSPVKGIMVSAFEDHRGLGPKVLLFSMQEGKRGPKGSAPIDMAFSAEDAKKLFETLETDINKINKTVESK